MGDEFDARDQYGNRYKARRAGGGGNAVDQHGNRYTARRVGDGCFTNLGAFILFGAVAVLAIGSIVSGLASVIGNGVFSPYHVFTADHNDAVRTAVRNYVGSGKYAGLFETDTSRGGSYLSKNDPNLSNVTLDPELGGFPGKAYTIDQTASSDWFGFDNVGIQRQGYCLLIVYIKPTPRVQHTIYARVIGAYPTTVEQDKERAYTFHIKPGADSGSVDIGTTGSDQYSYTVYIQGDVGTPFEAIVVDRSGQGSSSSTSNQAKPTPTPTPIRLAAKYSGTWVNNSYSDPAYNTHQAALEITTTNADGSFEGKWYDTFQTNDYNNDVLTAVYSVHGVSTQFNNAGSYGIDSVKLQHLQQQYGDSGALLQFTVTGFISANPPDVYVQAADYWSLSAYCFETKCTGSDFYGVLSNRSVQGVWFSNSSTNVTGAPDGTFKLTS